MSNKLLTENLSAPLSGATTATVEIETGTGNLTVDDLTEGPQVLASGSLQYFEKQGRPTESFSTAGGKTTVKLTANAAGRPWFRVPWSACLGGTEWQIHLNPSVPSEVTVHTGGGSVNMKLADMALTSLSVETGGGNLDILLPEHAAALRARAATGGGNISVELGEAMTGTNTVEANSGAGNVVVEVPAGIPARVDASTGLGKVIVEPRFSKIGAHVYQSAEYEDAPDKLDLSVHTGAGNISVTTK